MEKAIFYSSRGPSWSYNDVTSMSMLQNFQCFNDLSTPDLRSFYDFIFEMFFRPWKCIRHTQLRSFSQTHDKIPSNLKEAVDLSYTAYLPEDGNAMKQALIILDGVRWTIVSMQMPLKTWIFLPFQSASQHAREADIRFGSKESWFISSCTTNDVQIYGI